MQGYSSPVLRYFADHTRVGLLTTGGTGSATGPLGHTVTISVAVRDGVIVDARFMSDTCVVQVAACSLLTETVIGMQPHEAERLSGKAVVRFLGGIPMSLAARCETPITALRRALADAHEHLDVSEVTIKGAAS